MKTKKQIIDAFISENNLCNTAFVITNGSQKWFSEQEVRDAIKKECVHLCTLKLSKRLGLK